MANILVVDDEMGIRELLSEILYDEGHVVMLAENATQARAARNKSRPDLVLLDIWMPDTDGVTLLKEWALNGQLTMPVVMMSGHASIDTAVEATRIGALDFLEKPITLQKLLHTVQQGLLRSTPPDINKVVNQQMGTGQTAAKTYAPTDATPTITPTQHNPSETSPTAEINVASSMPPHLSPSALELSKLSLELPLREARDCFERIYFEYHLQQENANITRVAEKTGLERTHLYRKLKQLNIAISKANKK
ncbi:Sporulation initiation phosphotransferase F [Ephemeroptericola cinctiostellae]|uniref:Sporulation initiation phosphotransferase F n=1 Tax=Ephemeroptericola cinctiostellae TaxID=2268024 RepID=A0A345D8X7_9BURK|nr:response regulator [Ephemeroptericola cinctiostellae]AXF84815.1 Sporulation initiation phosphotransferase F [Ephemeroptericola cinctiostellae]